MGSQRSNQTTIANVSIVWPHKPEILPLFHVLQHLANLYLPCVYKFCLLLAHLMLMYYYKVVVTKFGQLKAFEVVFIVDINGTITK